MNILAIYVHKIILFLSFVRIVKRRMRFQQICYFSKRKMRNETLVTLLSL